LLVIIAAAICAQLSLHMPGSVLTSSAAAPMPGFQGQWSSRIYLPVVLADYLAPSGRLCRFGVGASSEIAAYRVNDLRIGWYTDWGSSLKPPRPGGIEYLQMVRLSQTGPEAYTSSPSGSALQAIVDANPGALWVIGNEPDRRIYQDSLEPQVYAIAYHDLYHQIKNADPTARLVAGSIVQPTPLRLQYLNMVLQEYRTRYGEEMPVDAWNIHAFILNEQSCDLSCPLPGRENCWGADIPPGINDCTGNTYTIEDNDNFEVFKQFIVDFREWMARNNYQERPLIITEFGVLMPEDFGFTPTRVNAFMSSTFDYLSTATGASGYGADKGRLVQGWAWYSLSNSDYNGQLFDAVTKARTAYGDNFASYTAGVTPQINLTPVRLWVELPVPSGSAQLADVVLAAEVANNGNIAMDSAVKVRFYDGDPSGGGAQIGTDQSLASLDGCGNSGTARVTWAGVAPGTTTAWVVVDPDNLLAESDELDNGLSAQIMIGP
jgi:hypothetical protein